MPKPPPQSSASNRFVGSRIRSLAPSPKNGCAADLLPCCRSGNDRTGLSRLDPALRTSIQEENGPAGAKSLRQGRDADAQPVGSQATAANSRTIEARRWKTRLRSGSQPPETTRPANGAVSCVRREFRFLGRAFFARAATRAGEPIQCLRNAAPTEANNDFAVSACALSARPVSSALGPVALRNAASACLRSPAA
jgi:hypothetical protein